MPSYNWSEYRDRPWAARYPEWASGFAPWRRQEPGLPTTFSELAKLRVQMSRSTPVALRVFVSHRQADAEYGRRIAWLAGQEGFDYWLDVLDPDLTKTPGLSAKQSALAIASVVEMALLNSTHVLAVMTPNTRGSEWVPYEYGRAKDPTMATLQAACWVGAGLSSTSLPQYLYLGPVHVNELDIRSWFRTERVAHGASHTGNAWKGLPPAPLP